MGRPRDLLKKEEITFDNHHPATAAEWDDDLHFHKRMTVNNPKGKQTVVSGVFHVKKNRGVGVTYDKGKEHPKIKDKTEREYFERKIKKEISDVIENSNDEARVFIDRVVTAVDSLSTGEIIHYRQYGGRTSDKAIDCTKEKWIVLLQSERSKELRDIQYIYINLFTEVSQLP